MPGGARISFNGVDSSLSSLKNCQSYINTGMDIATHVALDLVESFRTVALLARPGCLHSNHFIILNEKFSENVNTRQTLSQLL
ncbi:E3 SUMO-protein ligase NSE2 [Grus japonensis]|uniref:E3 SUMO-protein ligase NSE2 n=1 Tax=Grus japonensis TaxID=30415 RepID=A0ABC9W8S7_GRUJA